MKKLLVLLSSFLVTSQLTTVIVGCEPNGSNKSTDQDDPIDFKNPNADKGSNEVTAESLMKTRNMNWASILNKDYSQSSNKSLLSTKQSLSTNNVTKINNIDNDSIETTSTLAKKDLLSSKLLSDGYSFTPYTDIGIVEDSKEYLLKNKSLGGGYRDKVTFDSDSKAADNEYNNLAKLWNNDKIFDKVKDGITIGFMQNASDENELVPMWDAAPNKTSNNSAQWFQDRWDKWTKKDDKEPSKELLDASKVTISFGPFANSLWHEAYKNNINEEQLANKLAEIGAKYGTKKFDFYFAAPYLTNSGSYADSQRLLAGALKILIERDNDFDIRLSLVVSTKDGIASVIANSGGNAWDGDISKIGNEEFPLYMFTKFLGMNFRLNLVLPYLTYSDFNTSGLTVNNWEVQIMEQAITKTEETWRIINDKVNGSSRVKIDNAYSRMAITPWIGKRAEKAVYDFDANDALRLRKFANDKNIGQVSMFYLTRDYPSEFMSNGLGKDALADTNPIDQNIRSGSGYEKLTYAKVLSGKMAENDIPLEKTKKEDLKTLDGFLDYDNDIRNNKSLDEVQQQQGATGWDGVNGGNDAQQWENNGPSSNDGNVVSPTTPTTSSKSNYVDWKDANPNRDKNIVDKAESNQRTYFSPYLDAGLYEGNNIGDIVNKTKLDHLTLAFVQQVNSHNNSLDLSIAGIENKGEGYEWWKNSVLYEKDLLPLINSNNFENIKVAYGGATTGGYIEKNPWNLAYKLAGGDVNQASSLLSKALIGYNEDLASFASKKSEKSLGTPKNIDFDIEGEAQNDHNANKVLARTLANMKKADKSWNFSITLPVLPSGLTNVGYNVMDVFVNAFKEAGLNYKDLPVINLMLMDYGDPIYVAAKNKGETNFDLAVQAIENTKENLAKSIMANYKVSSLTNRQVHRLIGATPMIGVNDTVEGVFTLEDAKELYNWAQSADLAYLSMWSMNDDRGKVNNIGRPKSLISHGLSYLQEYDFSKAFNGQWDEKVKVPNKKA
ncbi:bifunctional chitinase/lysozyme [Spiroplasma gladiatoris]|uniref:Bifunctional chitinase/lysozyme n=1 Tax=Spiroplasma gladiatoris TaxID=2143 RepID=A0A4V1AQ53_9MOLU|nr:hypothetical protein [Spiroplasma gladiatoris]QBQ07299.1 bifunctional chitinase/lysozyme [Spiroplasma gladiatoris]